MNDEDLVVGYGLYNSAKDISIGAMPYERVKAVFIRTTRPVTSTEEMEAWLAARSEDSKLIKTVRRLWHDNKILSVAMWNIDLGGVDRWIPWNEFKG